MYGKYRKIGFFSTFSQKTALNGYKNPNDRLCGMKPTLYETLEYILIFVPSSGRASGTENGPNWPEIGRISHFFMEIQQLPRLKQLYCGLVC